MVPAQFLHNADGLLMIASRLLYVCGLLILLTACNLERPDLREDDADDSGIPTWEVQAATQAACEPRSDWLLYTVQRRDNLTIIANATGSSIDDLAAGNCLQNRNRLVAGQQILVPRLPGSTDCDDSLLTGDPDSADVLLIDPAQRTSDGLCYRLAAGDTLRINWVTVPTGVSEVTFYRRSSAETRDEVIGIDSNGADGFAVSWQVPVEMPPSILFARGTAGTATGESDPIGVFVP